MNFIFNFSDTPEYKAKVKKVLTALFRSILLCTFFGVAIISQVVEGADWLIIPLAFAFFTAFFYYVID